MTVTRKRRALFASMTAFIALSALVHFTLGATGVLIKFPTEEHAPSQMAILIREYHLAPTPRPTPTPRHVVLAFVQRSAPRLPAPNAEVKQAAPLMLRSMAASAPLRSEPVIVAPATSTPAPTQQQTPTPVETPLDATDMIVDATFRHQVRPVYPETARFEGDEGTVIILVTVGADGEPSNARIESSSGSFEIDRAALAAAIASTYQPPEVDGKPAIVTYRVIYTFSLG